MDCSTPGLPVYHHSWSLFKLRSIELVMPSNHLILVVSLFSHLQSFPASGLFPVSQFFTSGGQNIGASVSASVLPMNIQGCFSFRWIGLISLLSKGLSKVFSNTTVQKDQLDPPLWCSAFSIIQLSHPYMTTGKTIALTMSWA